MTALKVFLHNPNGKMLLGRLAYQKGRGHLELDSHFLSQNINLSPLHLKLSNNLQTAQRSPFNGLHGVFADSLPDGWGLLLMDRRLRQQGIAVHTITPLDRLAYIGDRAMGALSYQPDTGESDIEAADNLLSLSCLAQDALAIFEGSTKDVTTQLHIIGGSPGGARPKATIGLDGEKAIAGATDLPPGYQHWLVKFPTGSNTQARSEGAVEYIYSLMAQQAGIDFAQTRLINAGAGNHYFAARRFDRQLDPTTGDTNTRVHMHTFAGLVNADFRVPDADYELLIKATSHVTKSHQDCCEVLRRMIFNIISGNRDDHTKNFSFLMSPIGKWRLSPAYDVTFDTGINGHHSMSVMGYGQAIPKSAIYQVAALIPLSPAKVDRMLEEVIQALSQWPELARQFDVPLVLIREISTYINNETTRLT